MACVVYADYVVLINGGASQFFRASRGIRKGCPLSPFLFLLIIEALSLLICCAKIENKFLGLKISSEIRITHLLFIDGILLFGTRSVEEWEILKATLELFCDATSMCISEN